MPISFDRDKVGKRSLFLSKKFTDYLLSVIEALCNATFSPVGSGRLDVTENSAIYTINPGSSASSVCNLFCYDASSGGMAQVAITWGSIQGQQPTGMPAGGPMKIPVSGTFYIFAHATFDMSQPDLPATSVGLSLGAESQANTSSTAYQILGSGTVTYDAHGNASTNVSGQCGNVSFNPCSLVGSGGSNSGAGNGLGTGQDNGEDGDTTDGLGDNGGLSDSGGLGDSGGLSDSGGLGGGGGD
jgi:hypothetical protein